MYTSLSSFWKQPHGLALRAAPGGSGTLIMFRGKPNIATRPVATSTSTRIITSMRRLQRSTPASDPSRSRSNLPSSPHGISPGRAQGVVTVREGSVPVPLPRSIKLPGLVPGDASGDGLPEPEAVGLRLAEGVGDVSAKVSFRSSSNAISERPAVR